MYIVHVCIQYLQIVIYIHTYIRFYHYTMCIHTVWIHIKSYKWFLLPVLSLAWTTDSETSIVPSIVRYVCALYYMPLSRKRDKMWWPHTMYAHTCDSRWTDEAVSHHKTPVKDVYTVYQLLIHSHWWCHQFNQATWQDTANKGMKKVLQTWDFWGIQSQVHNDRLLLWGQWNWS